MEALSKVNHKNLMNLVGYCEDETPFIRMMVFEYVSNGSLFERLHGKFNCELPFCFKGTLWGIVRLQRPCYLLLTVFTLGLMELATVDVIFILVFC